MEPPLRVNAETHEDEATKGEKRTQYKRDFALQALLTLATWLAFFAAAVYAGITALQLRTANQTLIEAQTSSAKQFEKTEEQIRELQTSNKIATEANRAWLGISSDYGRDEEFNFTNYTDATGPYTIFRFVWIVANAGHRPAKIERVRTTVTWNSSYCTVNPIFDIHEPGKIEPIRKPGSKGLVIPNDNVRSIWQSSIPAEAYGRVKSHPPKSRLCSYISIEYRDASFPEILHHTRDCRFLVDLDPRIGGFAECENGYATAD